MRLGDLIKSNNFYLNDNYYILNLFGKSFETVYNDITLDVNPVYSNDAEFVADCPKIGEVVWRDKVISVGTIEGNSFNCTEICRAMEKLRSQVCRLDTKATFVLPTNLHLYHNNWHNIQMISEILYYFLEGFNIVHYERQHNRKPNWEELLPTVYGWGINDIIEQVKSPKFLGIVDGKRIYKQDWVCPYYSDWKHMVERGCCTKHKSRQPSYHDISICEEWRYFSNFIKWVDSQPNKNWMNCDLDKDLLVEGNRIYSPETCVYVDSSVNRFILKGNRKSGMMIGVTKHKSVFRSSCNNPTQSGIHYLGYHNTELEAHRAWQAKKHEYACKLAEQQQDPRVARVLRERYAPDKDWTSI